MSKMSERVPPRCARDYLPERLLAQSDGAVVFLARHRSTGRQVALKVGTEDPRAPRAGGDSAADAARPVERLTTEVLMTSRIDHPHVVRVLDQGLADELPWIAREFLPGPHLGEQVPVGGLPWQLAAQIGAQLAGALAAAHAAGVLHRDVKAGNVLKAANGKWKLTDFDVACETERAGVHVSTFAGTPGYVAPELIRGRPATVASEVYALGAVLYLMLTGRLPHDGEDALEQMQRCLEEDPAHASAYGANLPEDLDRLVLSALSRKPELRPASMEVFGARLWAILLEPMKKLEPSIPVGGAGAWGAARPPGRRTTVKRAIPPGAVAARATRTMRAVSPVAPVPPSLPRRLPRPLATTMVCLLVVTCGLLATHGTLIGESPAGAPFRALREVAARTMALAGGIGAPAEALKTSF